MKICHVNLAKGFRGGERQTQLLIEALAKRGLAQTLVCRRNEELGRRLRGTTALQIVEIGKPFMLHAGACKQADLIHAHEGKAAHFALFSGLWCNKPYVLTRRVMTPPRDNRFTHAVYRRAAAVIGLSSAIQSSLQHYDHRLCVAVIPSVMSSLRVNEPNVAQLKARYRGKRVIGHIGALVNEDKGQRDLIEAARQLNRSHANLQFVFLGQGKDETAFRQQASDLPNVEFIGFVENVGDYLSVFDLFAFPSLREGLGSILLDAMQFRRPIVATRVGGIPDVIEHEVNGLLVPPHSPDQLAAAITRLLTDSELCRRYTSAGETRLHRYRLDTVADQTLALYKDLCRLD